MAARVSLCAFLSEFDSRPIQDDYSPEIPATGVLPWGEKEAVEKDTMPSKNSRQDKKPATPQAAAPQKATPKSKFSGDAPPMESLKVKKAKQHKDKRGRGTK